jgi:ligand-binding sensor domain-containing protein
MKTSLILLGLFFITCSSESIAQGKKEKGFADRVRIERYLCENRTNMWIASNLGLICRNKKSGKEYLINAEKSILPSNEITCGISLSTGQTYIGTKEGILYWNNYSFMVINTENSDLPENEIADICVDKNENVFIKTKNCSLVKAIGRRIKVLKIENGNSPSVVMTSNPLDTATASDHR